MKKIIVSVVLILLVGTVFAQTKPVVVVAPFDTKGVDKDEADVITELFTAEYANTGTASVVDRNSFDKIKDQLKFQSSNWSNSDKVAELGKALNANHVVVGQLLKFRTQIAVTIKIIDVNTTTILASYTEKLEDIENLLDKLPEICTKLSSKVGGDQAKQYKIGDEGPGGGIVFYIKDEYIYEVIFLSTIANYEDTKNIVRNYAGGGYTNWRLPTKDEMRYIYYSVCRQRKDLWRKYWMSGSVVEYALASSLGDGKKRFVSFYADCRNVYKSETGYEEDFCNICLVRKFTNN